MSDLLDLDEQGLGVGYRANDGFDSYRVDQGKIDEQYAATKINSVHSLFDLTNICDLARLMQGLGWLHLHHVLVLLPADASHFDKWIYCGCTELWQGSCNPSLPTVSCAGTRSDLGMQQELVRTCCTIFKLCVVFVWMFRAKAAKEPSLLESQQCVPQLVGSGPQPCPFPGAVRCSSAVCSAVWLLALQLSVQRTSEPYCCDNKTPI